MFTPPPSPPHPSFTPETPPPQQPPSLQRPPVYRQRWAWVAALAVIGGGVALYVFSGGQGQTGGHATAQEAGQAPVVGVVTVQRKPVRIWSEYSGRVQATDVVEIRPRVSGTIEKIHFTEGATVQKDAPLFVIDPRPYEAALARAEAALTSARTQAELAKVERERAEELKKSRYVSDSIYDSRARDYEVGLATVKSAEAALREARLNLEYANIRAPIAGRISRAEITTGNLVEAGQNAPVLATIVSHSPVYAEFDVDEQTYLSSARVQGGDVRAIPVELSLTADSTVYRGTMHAFDNRINPTSGTIRARAVFENADGVLMPGMFATIRLGSATEADSILITDRAISTDQNKKYVYVVGEGNRVEYREVLTGPTVNGLRLIRDGLKDGERVVVSGLQRVRPDAVVQPEEASATQDAPAGNASAQGG